MPSLKPYLLERKLLPKVWGGRALERMFGIALPAGEQIGETWELFDRAGGSSRLRGTELCLADLMREAPTELLGRGVAKGFGGCFPLLLKFLDAREQLSVQVHPDDAQARPDGDSGKNEALLVLHAGPKASMVHGLRQGIARADFEARAHLPAVEAMLNTFVPQVGDCVYVPAGTVHATGPDVVGLEIQQNSDLTYRVYDWGRGREVHVAKALAVTRYDGVGQAGERPVERQQVLADGGRLLVATPWFRVRRYDLQQPFELASNGRFAAVTVLGGGAQLGWQEGRDRRSLAMVAGDTALVPASIPNVLLSPIGRLDVVVSDPGER